MDSLKKDGKNNKNSLFFIRFFLFTREIFLEINEYDLLTSLLNRLINEDISNVFFFFLL